MRAPSVSTAAAFAILLPVLPLLPACIDLGSLFAECDGDRDCDDDEECNDGVCEELECTKDSDCDPGRECRSDECKRIDCSAGEDCGEGAFCDVDGKCSEIPSGEGEGEAGEGEGEAGEGEGEGPGEGEGEGEGCGGVPTDGQCNGDVIEFCNGSFVDTINCNDAPFPAGQTDCQFVDATDSVACAVRAGSQCIINNGTELALCQGSAPGCRLDDADSGTCVSSAGACSTSDNLTCVGERFILQCNDPAGFGSGQPLFMDCGALGGSCDDSTGCRFQPGDLCTPDITRCGVDAFDSTVCPADGVCPGGGGGTFTHHSGTGVTFSNETPVATSSLQGAIDACNAHFGVTTCGLACGGTCTTVTRNAECACVDFVWHFGNSGCFTSGDGPGVVHGITTGCSVTSTGSWD